MICNIWGVTIILLIMLIIGLVVFSQKKDKEYQIENFDLPTNPSPTPTSTRNPTPTPTTIYNPSYYSNVIRNNNDLITDYIDIINNINPKIVLTNYNKNNSYREIGSALSSNVNIINTSLSELYGNLTNRDYTMTQLDKMEKTVKDLENITMNLNKDNIKTKQINRIKSLNNGMEMDLTSTNNTYFKDDRTGSNIAAYMVNVNDGCLSVGNNDYNVYKCNDTNPKQYFKMEHIVNEDAYQKAIDTALPFDNIDKSTFNYPFVMLKSLTNDNCLTNNHGNLTVQPCYSYLAQRWMAL
jgi:hypothetical protein